MHIDRPEAMKRAEGFLKALGVEDHPDRTEPGGVAAGLTELILTAVTETMRDDAEIAAREYEKWRDAMPPPSDLTSVISAMGAAASMRFIRVPHWVDKEKFWLVYQELMHGKATREDFEREWAESLEHRARCEEAKNAAEKN